MISKSKGAELAEAPEKYYLYILKGSRNHIYVGVTSNIDLRIERHKAGSGAAFTKRKFN